MTGTSDVLSGNGRSVWCHRRLDIWAYGALEIEAVCEPSSCSRSAFLFGRVERLANQVGQVWQPGFCWI